MVLSDVYKSLQRVVAIFSFFGIIRGTISNMLTFCVCALILTASVRADYDFRDSDFNQLLFDDIRSDFDDIFDEPIRFKRDTEADPMKNGCHQDRGRRDRDFHCCSGDKVDPKQIEVLREVKKQCISEIRGGNGTDLSFDPLDCAQMQILKEQMVCTGECIAKKFNLLDEQGKLKRDALLAHLRLKVRDIKWKTDGLEGFVDKCLAEPKLSQKSEDKISEVPINKKCNSMPLQFTHCIWKEFVQACPKDLQVDNNKCKKIRERLAKGDTSFLNKTFLHHFHSRNDDKKDAI